MGYKEAEIAYQCKIDELNLALSKSKAYNNQEARERLLEVTKFYSRIGEAIQALTAPLHPDSPLSKLL